MTEDCPASRQTSWRRPPPGLWPRATLLAAALLLQACTQERPVVTASGARVYAADVGGAAKSCDAPKVQPVDGKVAEASMMVGNDGGWCGVSVQLPGPKPYDAGLLAARPAHGNVLIHEVGDFTRVDYTPDRGFTGSDSFTVKLVPGGAAIRVSVTVTGAAPRA